MFRQLLNYLSAHMDMVHNICSSNAFSILMDILADEIRASSSAQGLGGNMRQVLDYVQEHGAITRPETEKLLGVSASTASRLLKEMIKNDLLIRQGKARNIKYVSAK